MRIAIYSILLASLALATHAFTLAPISAELDFSGRGAARNFRLENAATNRVAFQVTMLTREMDEFGKETYSPATNEFIVLPPQGIIGPKDSQVVRVVWRGTNRGPVELNYRILVEQLPIALGQEDAGSSINMLVRYMGTVYIRPKNAEPKIKLIASRFQELEGKPHLILTLENSGNAHQVLIGTVLNISFPDGRNLELSGDQLKGLEGENILAGKKRHFPIPIPEAVSEQKADVTLRWTQAR